MKKTKLKVKRGAAHHEPAPVLDLRLPNWPDEGEMFYESLVPSKVMDIKVVDKATEPATVTKKKRRIRPFLLGFALVTSIVFGATVLWIYEPTTLRHLYDRILGVFPS